MRGGVLSDSHIKEFCKEFRPVPMESAPIILKVEHPVNPLTGIKPIYNQTVAAPASLATMAANMHRINMKAGDITSDYSEILSGIVQDVKSEALIVKGEEETLARMVSEYGLRAVYEKPARGGARKGSGRMSIGDLQLKEQIQDKLNFEEHINKKEIQEAVRYSGGDFNEAVSRVVTDKKDQAVDSMLAVIMKRAEAQIKANSRSNKNLTID